MHFTTSCNFICTMYMYMCMCIHCILFLRWCNLQWFHYYDVHVQCTSTYIVGMISCYFSMNSCSSYFFSHVQFRCEPVMLSITVSLVDSNLVFLTSFYQPLLIWGYLKIEVLALVDVIMCNVQLLCLCYSSLIVFICLLKQHDHAFFFQLCADVLKHNGELV